jgi:acyl carrier protein
MVSSGHSLLEGPHLRLRPVLPNDYPYLYHLAVGTGESYRWRFRGAQPSFEEFVSAQLRQSVFCHFMVEAHSLQRPVGYAVCYAADIRSSRAYIGIQGSPELASRGLLIDAGRMLIDYLFTEFEFRKLYAECPGFVFDSFLSALGRAFIEEGRLRNHERFRGRWWDLHILALYRDTWVSSRPQSQFAQHVQLNSAGQGVTFDEFVSAMKNEFNLAEYELSESTSLSSDLGFDSVQIYELVCLIEECGSAVNDAAIQNLITVGDAYRLYLQAVTNRGVGGSP